MEQAIVRRLKPGTLEDYKAAAKVNGRSLEAELRAVIEAHRPRRRLSAEELLRMSDNALAMTPPNGPGATSDSTLMIRWDRDTGLGHDLDDGWTDDDAGR